MASCSGLLTTSILYWISVFQGSLPSVRLPVRSTRHMVQAMCACQVSHNRDSDRPHLIAVAGRTSRLDTTSSITLY